MGKNCAFVDRIVENRPKIAPYSYGYNLQSPVLKALQDLRNYSNSIVPGGLLVRSNITLLTPFTSLMIRFMHV